MAKMRVLNSRTTGLLGIMLILLSACSPTSLKNMLSFEKRPTEKPAFNEQNISKSFFVEANGKAKSFMCGWAAESVNGSVAEGWIRHLGHESMHCNVQFEITENYLIGKLVNPSFPNNPEKWTAAIRIPISKHYYYEKRRDEYGRETNVFIENTSRSHWSARPMITLNLSGLSIESWAYAIGVDAGRTPSVVSVSEVEWAQKPSFLGFTAQVTSSFYGGDVQANFRFNFLQFEHDKNFKKIPYSQANAKYFNILHIMGRMHDDPSVDNNELWVARWDLSKTTNLYIDNVPVKYQKIILDAVEAWNGTLAKIGASPKGVKAFKPILSQMKHPFDLRYPAIHWVEDKRISANSPLGIGQAHADVLNGKIMYGFVVLWGGMLDEYIRAYTPSSSISNSQGLSQYPFSSSYQPIPKSLALPARISEISALQNLSQYKPDALATDVIRAGLRRVEEINRILKDAAARAELSAGEQKLLVEESDRINNQVTELQKAPGVLAEMAAVAGDFSDKLKKDTEEVFSVNNLFEALGLANFQDKIDKEKMEEDKHSETLSDLKSAKTYGRDLPSKMKLKMSNTFQDEDRTVQDMVDAVAASPEFSRRNHDDILNSVITSLTLHEIGHFLNLGHQFKGNIVPDLGTVPSSYVKDLSALATAEKNFSNYTTVMDYRSGRAEAATPVGHIKPGPHDELVLRYVYNGTYTTYDKEKDTFIFDNKVGADGVIPNMTAGKYPTAYFPACNDLEASYSADPFCNRWDSGTTAQDIVESYFQTVRDNLTSSLYAFSDARGKSAKRVEANLWYRGLSTFSRVRLFYDEMRRYMRLSPHLSKLFNRLRKDEDSLHEFSQACQKNDPKDIDSVILKEMMKDPKLKDLCLANLKVLSEFKTLISLPDADYPLIDFKNRYIQGGYMAGETLLDIGKFFGTWYQMANYPLKASALYTLTTANPYIVWGGIYPNPFYDHEEDRNLYMMLYPREYTQIIADTVKYNLRFGDTSESATTSIGKSILSLSWMIPLQKRTSNDFGRFPDNFVDMLTIQTQFDLGYMYIVITGVDPEGEDAARPRNFKRFTGTAFEPRANKAINLTDIYLLPQGRVLSRANNAFLYPISKLRFFSEKDAFVVALKADFDIPAGDRLNEDSVKQSLTTSYDQIIGRCIIGRNGAGLSGFFQIGKPEFKGFYIPPMIHQDSDDHEKMNSFLKSIEEEFKSYETYAASKDPGRSMTSTCNETMRGISQVLSTSALLSGTWVPLIEDRLVK